MLPDHVRALRNQYPMLAKNLCLELALRQRLEREPVDFDDNSFDLNPHLGVARACREVAGDVVASGFECTETEVMLHWLTSLLHLISARREEKSKG